MEKIDLSKLSQDDRKALMEQLEAEDKANKERIKAERDNYKTMVNETVRESFVPLMGLSKSILDAKKQVFDNFETIIALKGELFGTKEEQQSHTFTTIDGNISIKLGHRVNDNFDDTLSSGIEKVKAYMATLAKDTESAALVETIMDLLKKDAKGNLKAQRVLELRKLANRVHNAEFSDGIRIIEESYKPVKTCQFIEVKFKDEHGKEHALPLSISAFDL
ncbi:MAG: DUF3164 family protein [Dysgonamonadaceae bacterium]|jgi:hypothetical protein|nr:DUF3164 family protein [Dysgonamonadaceae bacterium]